MTNKGKLIIYAGPSGSGKGTIKDKFVNDPKYNIVFSVSATTRQPRAGEKHKREYYFISKQKFQKWIDQNKFLEWAEYSNNYYGTPLKLVEKSLSKGKNVLLEIELDGVIQVLKKMPEALTIFLMPPSLEVLKKRLINRETDTPEQIQKRIAIAKKEIANKNIFKYVVVNDKLDLAVKHVKEILDKELL